MHKLTTRARAEAYLTARPVPTPRKLTLSQRVLAGLLWLCLAPLLLLAFLLAGERPTLHR